MRVKLARIDNRLMHGIVISQYLPSVGAQRIMVVDDEVALDPMKKEMMMFAKPNGYACSIIPLEKATENIKAGKYGDQVIFLLAKSPVTVLELMKAGAPIDTLMIGATDRLEGIRLSQRAFLTEEELEACREIKNMGVPITVQHAPNVPNEDLWKIVK
ncbi:MAG: PTS sugar transporter subunit IIB [Erysipelotrichaceae bacterium]|nr:PTS sugar transporter subunit IIB [Erysipelotrichaceae bacterium]